MFLVKRMPILVNINGFNRFRLFRLIYNLCETIHTYRIIDNRIFSLLYHILQQLLNLYILAFGKQTFKDTEIYTNTILFKNL
jgi:hypothetical protein